MATAAKKFRNRKSLDNGTDSILEMQEHGYTVERLSPYQWRVNERLDLYPTNRKYHDIIKNERGYYTSTLDICKQVIGAASSRGVRG